MTGQPGGEWVVPSSTSPCPPATWAAAVVSASCACCQPPPSRTSWMPLFFCLMTVELPSTEIAQKWRDIYDVRGEGRWWVTSTQKGSKLVDKCPSLLFSKGKNLRHILRGSWGSPVRLSLSHYGNNQTSSTLPWPLLLSRLFWTPHSSFWNDRSEKPPAS